MWARSPSHLLLSGPALWTYPLIRAHPSSSHHGHQILPISPKNRGTVGPATRP